MSKPLWFRGKKVLELKNKAQQIKIAAQKSNILFFAIALAIFAIVISLWDSQTTAYAHAATGYVNKEVKTVSPLLENKSDLFKSNKGGSDTLDVNIPAPLIVENVQEKPLQKKEAHDDSVQAVNSDMQSQLLSGENKLGIAGPIFITGNQKAEQEKQSHQFAEKLYTIVGETPIKEMVPFISERDDKVAAFLIGMAKKESSFGLASPSKDGQTCYNYWGYKGEGQRGTGMGYACFASAEEAIKVVGDRIETLVGKGRNTPARMVDTWKCGVSCAGDPGAPSWTATVALYFNQIVDQNS